MTAYQLIIAGSLAIILSYFFSQLSRKTNIPSVLLLILTGIIIGLYVDLNAEKLMQPLEVLGVVGLIMIVLEGALDLELSRDKFGLIRRSSLMALLVLILSVLVIGLAIHLSLRMEIWLSFLYATPLSVISSAIVIPSVENLGEHKKEFLIYESCISDILGIMLFYLLLGMLENADKAAELGKFTINLLVTIVISIFTSFGLIFLFKYIKSKVKIFLFLAILIVLYAIEKSLQLSPLILILFFGLMLKNNQVFFRGRLSGIISRMEFRLMERNFHIITRETAFVLRTFFFIVFGITMKLNSLLDVRALLLSLAIVLILFLLRYLGLMLFGEGKMKPMLYIAPRGLITVLLFYTIPGNYQVDSFPTSVILYVVLITSLVMTYGLISDGKETVLVQEAKAVASENDSTNVTDNESN